MKVALMGQGIMGRSRLQERSPNLQEPENLSGSSACRLPPLCSLVLPQETSQ